MYVLLYRKWMSQMSQYIEWPGWHIKSQLFHISVSYPSAVITNGLQAGCSSGYKNKPVFPFFVLAISIRSISLCSQQIRQISTWINRLSVCLLKFFDQWKSADCLNARVKEHTLTNWYHVRYEEKKVLYLLCTVYAMYCICKDKSTRVLQEDVLV